MNSTGWTPPSTATKDLAGLRSSLAVTATSTAPGELKRSIQRPGQERLRQRMEEERGNSEKVSQALQVDLGAVKMTSAAEIDVADPAAPRDQSAARPLCRNRSDVCRRQSAWNGRGLRMELDNRIQQHVEQVAGEALTQLETLPAARANFTMGER